MVSRASGRAGPAAPFDCSPGCGGGKAAARRFCVRRCAGEAGVGSARAPLQCGAPAAGRGPLPGPWSSSSSSPGDSVRADRASRCPGSAFYRSLHRWRGERGWERGDRGASAPRDPTGGQRPLGSHPVVFNCSPVVRPLCLSSPSEQCCLLLLVQVQRRLHSAMKRGGGVGGVTERNTPIRFSKVMVLKGMERGWTQSTGDTTERVGVGDRMLIFSHPREVTEKSVRRGEETCLIHSF